MWMQITHIYFLSYGNYRIIIIYSKAYAIFSPVTRAVTAYVFLCNYELNFTWVIKSDSTRSVVSALYRMRDRTVLFLLHHHLSDVRAASMTETTQTYISDFGGESAIHELDLVADILSWVTFGCLCQVICTFGVLTNVMNIVCFVNQGFNDPINISFLGMSPQRSYRHTHIRSRAHRHTHTPQINS